MRISTAHYHQQAIESINERSSAMAKLQEQLTTGKRINRASDDPIGAAEANGSVPPRPRWRWRPG